LLFFIASLKVTQHMTFGSFGFIHDLMQKENMPKGLGKKPEKSDCAERHFEVKAHQYALLPSTIWAYHTPLRK